MEEGKLVSTTRSQILQRSGACAISLSGISSRIPGKTEYPKDFDMRRDYTEDDLFQRKIVRLVSAGAKGIYAPRVWMLGISFTSQRQVYGDFLEERVFKPLEMSTAGVISEADIVPNRAAGYRVVNGQLKNQNWVSPSLNTTADGALYLTIYDMAKWDASLYTEKLLKKSSLEQMWTPVKLNAARRTLRLWLGTRRVQGTALSPWRAWPGFKISEVALPATVDGYLLQTSPEPSVKIARGVAAL